MEQGKHTVLYPLQHDLFTVNSNLPAHTFSLFLMSYPLNLHNVNVE